MKRDLDLVRALLLALEECENWVAVPKIDGVPGEVVAYHLQLLIDAGYLVAAEKGRARVNYQSGYRLTWEGHELLDSARKKDRWQKAKGLVESAGGVAFDVFKTLLTDLAKRELGL